jgi:pimeloyl-ACP methyl ester carboxylesterase
MKAGAAMVRRNPDAIRKLVPLSPIEKEMLRDPAKQDLLVRTMLDASKQGTAALVQHGALLPGPWGLPLCRVAVPVTFFHGTADRLAPPWMSPYLARQIPGATVRFVSGEGHLSLAANHAAEILAAVVGG